MEYHEVTEYLLKGSSLLKPLSNKIDMLVFITRSYNGRSLEARPLLHKVE
ncbi:MAG: hypothetical protein BWY65_01598 [Firmicutes bacterium ADurb.Bin373]|nr:MAG: hypothetical protein BWY65_01598 [Firmicutes bacterium ADurb.Bin373]